MYTKHKPPRRREAGVCQSQQQTSMNWRDNNNATDPTETTALVPPGQGRAQQQPQQQQQQPRDGGLGRLGIEEGGSTACTDSDCDRREYDDNRCSHDGKRRDRAPPPAGCTMVLLGLGLFVAGLVGGRMSASVVVIVTPSFFRPREQTVVAAVFGTPPLRQGHQPPPHHQPQSSGGQPASSTGAATGRGAEAASTATAASSSPTNSKYTKVQYFGFQIYTGGAPAFLPNEVDDDGDHNTNTNNGTTTPNPECIGRHSYGEAETETDPVLQCYLGHNDPIRDVQRRLAIMAAAVERAYNESQPSSASTLKIFVAPEFYWRGVEGAYRVGNLTDTVTVVDGNDHPCRHHRSNPICAILRGLQELVQDVRYKDWLFVFGTIVASQSTSRGNGNDGNDGDDDPGQHLYYNFAPVYKGFDPAGMPVDSDDGVVIPPRGKRFLLPKRYVSTSDFLTPSRDVDWERRWQELLGVENQPNTTDNPSRFDRKRYDDVLFSRFKRALEGRPAHYAIIEYDWLMMDGLTLSLEICFDHQKRTALDTYLGDASRGRLVRIPSSSDDDGDDDEDVVGGKGGGGLRYVPIPPHLAQISLVSSAGMTIVPDSLALADRGHAFLQDGLSNAPSYRYVDRELRDHCDQGLQFDGGTEAVSRHAVVSNTDVNFLYTVIEPVRRVPVFDDDGDDASFIGGWREALRDAYSAVVYEPHLVVHDPVDIATVNG